jgi:hypothetical protein
LGGAASAAFAGAAAAAGLCAFSAGAGAPSAGADEGLVSSAMVNLLQDISKKLCSK